MPIRTLDELLAIVPEPLRPTATLYAPVLLRWAVEDAIALADWIVLAASNEDAAFTSVLAAMTDEERAAEAAADLAAQKDDARLDAQRLAERRRVALSVLGLVAGILLAAVGL